MFARCTNCNDSYFLTDNELKIFTKEHNLSLPPDYRVLFRYILKANYCKDCKKYINSRNARIDEYLSEAEMRSARHKAISKTLCAQKN
ncbi:hypothetical protein A2645_00105 [Candidatus Nomurabacteria bacterium RIFCSPHIGHO2_01_FULL_39_9]|uniref:Uncharacterized protein n=1 Tax=Candidatus Nomurabacteria bacterium RIFCSPHIGHO2_01_FULL_39_9 TaxID=1801735 RepID=A0A1F6UVL1_9BACT|nr:MAG: hypothetical protein A2645_00105 [Candidatus Nomurabacteria bacterium RIFCSPHIGHO2_01_FULL_39_9]